MGVFHAHAVQSTYYKPIDQGGIEISGPAAMKKDKGKDKKKRHKKVKKDKKLTLANETDKDIIESVPRSLVFHRSSVPVGKYLKRLEEDLKSVMLPYTALKTEVSSKASFKDIVQYATKVWISHFLILSLTEVSPMLKIAKLPLGPTLTFRIKEYTTRDQLNDFRASLKRSFGLNYTHYTEPMKANPPLIIMNKFSAAYTVDKPYLKVVQSTLQHMFPPLDLDTFQLHNRRVVLFEYDPENDTIEWRHYAITIKGSSEEQTNEEDGEESKTVNKKQIALEELGPRITLELYKIESEFMDGDVLFHSIIKKSADEEEELRQNRLREKASKEQRKRLQEENVQKKKDEQEQKKSEKMQKAERSLQKALESIEKERSEELAQEGLDEIAVNKSILEREDEEEQMLDAEEEVVKPKKKKSKKSKKAVVSQSESDGAAKEKPKKKKSKKDKKRKRTEQSEEESKPKKKSKSKKRAENE